MDGNAVLLGLCISVVVVGVGVITNPLPSADIQTCPLSFANDTQDAFGLFNKSAYVQLGLTHRIPCLAYSYRENETLALYWYKLKQSIDGGDTINGGGAVNRVIYQDKQVKHRKSDRYSLASDFGLLIKGIVEIDAGEYQCVVLWEYGMKNTHQKETIYIQVIGHTLPHGSEAVSEGSSPSHLERGRRHTLQCGCASQTPDTQDSVVYWSMGEGVTTDTQIIGARFSNGTTLQIQHGADYSIGINASLTINSLNDVQRTQRFWCNVFQSDAALHSCTTDVQIQDGNPSFVLMASPTVLYLPEGFPQVLPCRSWTPGDVMCGVQWIHEQDESSQRVVLSYNLSTDTVQADSDYDLASDFGLRIKSVKPTHDGRYTCYIEDGSGNAPSPEALDTHVIGDSFPASPYTGNMSSSVTVMQGQGMTLLCECAQQSADASILAVYWSKGEGKNSDTDVIAARLANGSLLNSKNNGFSISSNWSLSVNSLNDSSSFWCHVFRSDGTLSNCHTDVRIMQETGKSKGSAAGSAILGFAILGSSVVLLIVIAVVLLYLWYRRWVSTSSCQMGEWLERDKLTYVDPELFHITPQGRERLNVEQHSDFFIGSTNESGCVLQGRSGSGKTHFLNKLQHDLQNVKRRYFLCRPKMVFLTEALHIRQAVRNIKRHMSYILHLSDAVILVDDCNGVKEMEEVLKATKGLSRCQLVIAIRSAKLAQDMSREHGWCHVTITGFSESNAREYIKSKLACNSRYNSLHQYFSPPEVIEYLDQHILFNSVDCLPGFLKRLCDYRDVRLHNSVSDVVTGILKCMFRTLHVHVGTKNSLAECSNANRPTQKQNEFLANFGKIVLRGMLDHSESEEGYQMEIFQSLEGGNDVLNWGFQMGLLSDGNKESKREIKRRKSKAQVSKAPKSSIVNLSEVGASSQASNIETSTAEGSSCSQASSIENLNAEVFESQNPFKITRNDIEEVPSPLESIVENSNANASSLQESNTENSNIEVSRPEEFHRHAEISTAEESIPLLTDQNSKVRFALELFRDFCAGKELARNPQEWMEKIDWNNEQVANIVVFAAVENKDVARAIVQRLFEMTKPNRKQECSGSLKEDFLLQKLAELCLKVNFGRCEGPLDNEINVIFPEGQLQFVGISSHRLRLLANCLKYTSRNKYKLKLRSVVLFRIDESLSLAEFKQYVEYLYPGTLEDRDRGLEEEASTACQLKESQESPNYKSVLHALKSELMDAQSGGECHSSTSASDLICYLPDQEHLEKIVLLGTVIGSQQIRHLMDNIGRLKHLKQLDLRLNTQTNDVALEKIVACEALTDLRLSLYKVTAYGFEDFTGQMKEDATLLRRLQTLYLLHGCLSQSFDKFLTDIIEYMDNLQCFHVSALVESDYEQGIPDEVVKAIHQKLPLNELIVDNKDALMREQLGEPQLAKGATTSSQDSHVVDMADIHVETQM